MVATEEGLGGAGGAQSNLLRQIKMVLCTLRYTYVGIHTSARHPQNKKRLFFYGRNCLVGLLGFGGVSVGETHHHTVTTE